MQYLILFILFISQISLADKPSLITFNTLEDHLTEDQKAEIPYFDSLIETVKLGNISSKTSLAYLTYVKSENKELNKIGLKLYQDIYNSYGYDLGSENKNEFIQIFYDDLAASYLNKDLLGIQHRKAFQLMFENFKKNTPSGEYLLNKFLSDSNLLPLNDKTDHPDILWTLWKEYDQKNPKKSLKSVIEDLDNKLTIEYMGQLEPDQSLFKTCQAPRNQMSELVVQYKQFQNQILASTSNKDQALNNAVDYFNKVETFFPNQRITFNFSKINVQSVIQMILFSGSDENLNLKFNKDLYDSYIEIHMTNVPSSLVLTRLFETFNFKLLCYEDWIMVQAESKLPIQYLVTGSFQLENSMNSKSKGLIKWDDGTSYSGGVKNGRLKGQGLIKIPVSNDKDYYEIKGKFKDDVLNGDGEYIASINETVYEYKGQFKNGLYHGKGHYRDNSSHILTSPHFFKNKIVST